MESAHGLIRCLALLAALVATTVPLGAQCLQWKPGFGHSGNGLGTVIALEVFDDGQGPALFAGGNFTSTGGASNVARWDGASWAPAGNSAGSGVSPVYALAEFDDGTGPALFAAGSSSGGISRVSKWNGSSWSSLGTGMTGGFITAVYALAVFDDGTGPALFAGGAFTSAGGVSASGIAKWNGSSWAPVGNSGGSGVNGAVYDLAVFDDGGGAALFAGGDFTTAGATSSRGIAKWDGTSWSALGNAGNVYALAVYDDGGGPALFAGGAFEIIVGSPYIASWDGTSWSALGSGMNKAVGALAVFDDGAGPALYAGGVFTSAGGVSANRIARWDGSGWSALGSGIDAGPFGTTVYALASFNDGADAHPDLYVGGDFSSAGGIPSLGIAQWFGGTTIDTDLDGLLDCADNCPGDFNPAQQDCDSDGLGDLCAISSGASTDANSNGLPDECEGSSYCSGKTSSLGCMPFVSSSGFASVTSQNAFQVMASDCLPNQIGLLLYGHAPSTLSFHGGTLCVNAPKVQFPGKLASPTGTPPCSGILHSNLNKRIQSGIDPMLTAGAQVYAQWRQRDSSDPAGFGDSLSNGLTFVVQP